MGPWTVGYMPRALLRSKPGASKSRLRRLAEQGLVMAGTLLGRPAAGFVESPDALASVCPLTIALSKKTMLDQREKTDFVARIRNGGATPASSRSAIAAVENQSDKNIADRAAIANEARGEDSGSGEALAGAPAMSDREEQDEKERGTQIFVSQTCAVRR